MDTEETLQARPSTESDTAIATNEWDDASIDSSSTSGGHQVPPINKSGNSFLLRKAQAVTVTNDTLRDEISSDADDEQDPASDTETLTGGDIENDEDDGHNMDKDDEGLHQDLNAYLKLGKRTRGSDGSLQDEGMGAKHYNTEQEQSPTEDKGNKKRVRRDADITYKLARPDSMK